MCFDRAAGAGGHLFEARLDLGAAVLGFFEEEFATC